MSIKARMLALPMMIYVALFLCGCGAGPSTGNGGGGSPVNVTGNYEGSRWFVDSVGIKSLDGPVHGPIIQTGASISPSMINFMAPFCFQEARVMSGNVSGNAVTMTLRAYDDGAETADITLTGKLSGNVLTGKVDIAGANLCSGFLGDFALTRVGSITGNWTGTLTSSIGETLELSGSLTQTGTIMPFPLDNYGVLFGYDFFGNPAVDGFVVNHTFTSPTGASTCFPSTNAAGGRIAGTHLLIDIRTNEHFIRLDGQVLMEGNSFDGTYAIYGGSCDGQGGTVKMKR